ncbi:MAG: hypothetical protein WBW33_34940 [Bryobacteraceae bacterium]
MTISVSALKYYLHDGVTCFRIQLLGTLSEADLPELAGCWRTARSSVIGRRLVIDSKKLDGLDDAGRRWLAEMIAEGAVIEDRLGSAVTIPARFDMRETASKADAKSSRRRLGKLRAPAVEST